MRTVKECASRIGYYRQLSYATQRMCGTHFDRIVTHRQPFKTRHIGPSEAQKQQMLQVVGCQVMMPLNSVDWRKLTRNVTHIVHLLCRLCKQNGKKSSAFSQFDFHIRLFT